MVVISTIRRAGHHCHYGRLVIATIFVIANIFVIPNIFVIANILNITTILKQIHYCITNTGTNMMSYSCDSLWKLNQNDHMNLTSQEASISF